MAPTSEPIPRRILLSLLLLSTATLTFEIDLTRLFSVAQFYHFAFMIVSIALLGYGASGTALTIFPGLRRADSRRSMAWLALATGIILHSWSSALPCWAMAPAAA